MAVSFKKILLCINSILLFVVWILQLNSGPYLRDRPPFMFLGTWMLWLVTGIAHLKIFKLKAKLAFLICQTSLSFALALVDTLNRNIAYTYRSDGTRWEQSESQVKRQVRAIYAMLWCVFALFFIITIMRIAKQFGRKNE